MKNLSKSENELYQRIDEILFYLWDPIGVSFDPEAREEYYSYIPQVFSMLKNGSNEEELLKYLYIIEKENMCLNPSKEKIKEVVELLIEWKEYLINPNI